ncbi:hypothetical protein Halru_0853 [Halovivax ruber XH-70]|uniref:Uncharacterized protein n=1 Tax=Halovivax ruber (strain DSM 18193 / JCM 13892 / XH-70) TaxID=797302 RepID=L0IBZ3_HALRX|nr:hypothetical protein [Halovivax ruber]AGB15477.1 hypothetical protein Halru_0853 [Halovivax ruber XH-70]
MRDRIGPALWFPERPPKRSESLSAGSGVALVLLIGSMLASPWWPGIGAGFVTAVLALGPVANTALGDTIGHWFRAIGLGGRLTVTALYCCVMVLIVVFVPVPFAAVANVLLGGLLGVTVYVASFLLWARSGPDRQGLREGTR